MTEFTPKSTELVPKHIKELNLTDEEFKYLFDADPDEPATQEWMDSEGLAFGDDIIVHTEGRPDAVYTTRQDDFMTRQREESKALQATAAPKDFEQTEIEVSKKIPIFYEHELGVEREPEVEHIQDGMAEVALEEAEIDDPRKFEQELRAEMGRESLLEEVNIAIRRLTEANVGIDTARVYSLSLADDQAKLRRIANDLENGNHPDGGYSVRLQLISESLMTTRARLRLVQTDSAPEVRKSVEAMRVGAEAVAAPLQDILYAVGEVNKESNVNISSLNNVIGQLETVISSSRRGIVDSNVFQALMRELGNTSKNTESISKYSGIIEEAVSKIRALNSEVHAS